MKFSLIYADIAGIKETHHKNQHNDELEFNLVNETLNKQTNKHTNKKFLTQECCNTATAGRLI